MATDYISREAAIENALAAVPRDNYFDNQIETFIRLIPAADVRKNERGEWTRQNDYFCRDFLCSNCKKLNDRPSKFCPDCGAIMEYDYNEDN